jgi:RES domain-containing protein
VYTAGSLALAALETFVHLGPAELPPNLSAVAAEIPDEVQITQVDLKRLPRNWRRYPAPAALQQIGMRWLAESATAVLAVPSVVIPAELNYLINPAHPESARIIAHAPQPFKFDPRMWKGR